MLEVGTCLEIISKSITTVMNPPPGWRRWPRASAWRCPGGSGTRRRRRSTAPSTSWCTTPPCWTRSAPPWRSPPARRAGTREQPWMTSTIHNKGEWVSQKDYVGRELRKVKTLDKFVQVGVGPKSRTFCRRTGTQGLINPKKSCQTNSCVSDVRTGLGNMPEVVLTP